jgi:hypothetical protein
VVRVADAYPGAADLPGLLDYQLDRPLRSHLPPTVVGVEERRGRGLAHDVHPRHGGHQAPFHPEQVVVQPGHAVRLHARKVGVNQRVRDDPGLLFGDAGGDEDLLAEPSQ